MSVTVSQKILTSKKYDDLGVIASTDAETVDVTYTAVNVDSITTSGATAYFDVHIGGSKTNKRFAFTFSYTGSGNPLDQAESALKTYLS